MGSKQKWAGGPLLFSCSAPVDWSDWLFGLLPLSKINKPEPGNCLSFFFLLSRAPLYLSPQHTAPRPSTRHPGKQPRRIPTRRLDRNPNCSTHILSPASVLPPSPAVIHVHPPYPAQQLRCWIASCPQNTRSVTSIPVLDNRQDA